jgi:[ribosomal protein S5]-alanine N-acetyltransferase
MGPTGVGEFRMPSYSDLLLSTARLDLRPLAPVDAAALFALKSDAVVQRYGSHAPWTALQEAVDYIERDRRDMAEGRHAQFAVVRREDGTMLGTCTLYALDAQCRRADVGYALLPSAWGRGYANEAVTALLDWGFEHLDLNRVEADIDPRNAASARALERLGFTREGHLRERWIVGGEVSDSAIYGLLAGEWQARAKPG